MVYFAAVRHTLDARPSRRFCFGLLLAFVVSFGGLLFATNYLIDPYVENNLWTTSLNRRKFRHTEGSVRLLFEKLDGDVRYILVFGTSQIRLASPDILGAPTLNFDALFNSYRRKRDPRAILYFLRQLNPRQAANIAKIYFQLDPAIFVEDRGAYQPLDFRSRRFFLRLSLQNFNIDKVLDAVKTVVKNLTGTFDQYVDADGFKVELDERRSDSDETHGHWGGGRFSRDSVDVLKEIDRFAKEGSIPAIYFELPRAGSVLAQMDFAATAELRRAIIGSIDHFYDLVYLDGVSDDHSCFYDEHLNTAATRKIFREILIPQDARYRVDAGNLARHLTFLEGRFAEARKTHGL